MMTQQTMEKLRAMRLPGMSDAAFKVFAWLCLNADRYSGRVQITIPEMAQVLRRSESGIQAALNELVDCRVCHCLETAEIEVAGGLTGGAAVPGGGPHHRNGGPDNRNPSSKQDDGNE